jgi:hypothetical protein
MKESEINNQVRLKLNEFETIAELNPSAAWKNSLMERLESTGNNSGQGMFSSKFTFVILFIFLVNIGFLMNSIVRNSYPSKLNEKELQALSSEFLINPVSINN